MSDEEDEPEIDEEEEDEDEEAIDSKDDEKIDDEGLPAGEGKEGRTEAEVETNLDKTMIAECLSMLMSLDCSMRYAYCKLECVERDVTNVSLLREYIHLRYINLAKNLIKDMNDLSGLTQAIYINLEENNLSSTTMDISLIYLQHLNLSRNRIRVVENINHPNLQYLNLSTNQISSMMSLAEGPCLDPLQLSNLVSLDLSSNQLTTTAGIQLPKLKQLYLASNSITKLEDTHFWTSLVILHLRNNPLELLDGFNTDQDAPQQLQYINLRGCNVIKSREVRKFQKLAGLKALVLSENPCAEDEDYRMEVLAFLRQIVRLDKDEFEQEERLEADAVLQMKLDEEREELEKAALLKAEEEELAAAMAAEAAANPNEEEAGDEAEEAGDEAEEADEQAPEEEIEEDD